MRRTDAIIIGGGQAGLAMSRCLGERKIDHLVLERGRIAERWRSERWDSLKLLTPNWLSRLPGWSYRGPDPDGYMSAAELVDYLEGYAQSFSAPVQDQTTVLSVSRTAPGYCVVTDRGTWLARVVVIATGHASEAFVPDLAHNLAGSIEQIVPARYRRPDDLPDGGVLVVGAAATGVQLAEEIHRSGRPVTLSVSKHIRLPRRYRGRDVMWWLDRMGILDQRSDQVENLGRSRSQPSLQLVGRDDHRDIDLDVLQRLGIELVGKTIGADGHHITCADDLLETTRAADARLQRVLHAIDDFAAHSDMASVPRASRIAPVAPKPSPQNLDLHRAGIKSVVWCTGFRRSYPWLNVPVLDARGELRHHGGVTPAPGLYALGLMFMQRRSSSFIDGVGKDAEVLARSIERHLENRRAIAA